MDQQITILTTTSSFSFEDIPSGLKLVKNPHKRRLKKDELKELIFTHQPHGIIAGVEPLTKDVLDGATNLKVISRCGIDLESIDQKAAKQLGILVYSTRTAPDLPLGELTVTMILSLLKKIREMDTAVRSDNWKRSISSLLSDKTVGIIGCGLRGSRVGHLLEPFGCQLIGCDVHVRRHELFEMVDIGKIFSQSNIITLHTPLTGENYHLIGKDEIEKMKDGVIIINTARGGLIDEEALFEGLQSGKIGGAGLDVFEEEPYRGPLNDFQGNVILTPHIGSFAGTYRFDMESEAMQNMITGLKKQGIQV